MTSKYGCCGVLIVSLSVTLAVAAKAQGFPFPSGPIVGVPTGAIVAGIVGTAAVLVVATVVIVHYSKKRAITGCVVSGDSGMTLTDETNKQIYMLSGDTAGIKPGDRVKLQGKKVKPRPPDTALVWETKDLSKDLGACRT